MTPRSRLAPPHKPGVEADLPDVVAVEEPAEEALQAEAVAAVLARAELALVGVEVVRAGVKALALVPANKMGSVELHSPVSPFPVGWLTQLLSGN